MSHKSKRQLDSSLKNKINLSITLHIDNLLTTFKSMLERTSNNKI